MKRVELLLQNPLYLEYLYKNARYETKRRFCRHDFQHMLDVARVTYILLLEGKELGLLAESCSLSQHEQVKEVIYAAGLVHDIARWLQYETGEDHAAAGAELARPLLCSAGFSAAEAAVVAEAVREHRTSSEKSTMLGKYLCRADDLSRPCFQCRAREDCYKFGNNGGECGTPVY